MGSRTLARITAVTGLMLLSAVAAAAPDTTPRKTLQAFASERELAELFRKWREQRPARIERRSSPLAALAPAPAAPAAEMAKSSADASAHGAKSESVTNVQHAGVDEGGIVKVHGDHLVILRRGRLFTVNIADRELKPVSTVDAYGGDVDPRGAWYDEMLISGNTIVVIGYSYARGGTEIGLFDISPDGGLTYRDTYHLRSNDYYSSRNYASRLIGTKLVFYTPLRLNPWASDPFAAFPAMRRWQPHATPADFKRIAPATRIYRTDEEIDPDQGLALHTVAICDLANRELDCTSSAVMGPPGRVFYVSDTSVFVWTSAWRRSGTARAAGSGVFRIPLDGSAPSALKTYGTPIDQFSFLESEDGHLNVLLRAVGSGDGMWGAERGGMQLALMRVPLSSFSDGRDGAPRAAYRQLPTPTAGSALQSRYIGPYLVFGAGTGWRRPQPTAQSHVYAIRYAGESHPHALPLVHGVDRIEALGRDAVIVGSDGRDLHFTSLRLGARPQTADRYTRPNAAQGETRSHGFYYRASANDEGLVGLPIIGGRQAASGQLRRAAASVLFLRKRALTLTELGTLDSQAERSANDACVASCVDWYGNSRPLFLRNRVFALMGYELVEGALSGGRITETQRVSFAPHWIDRISWGIQ
ncbi:MAG TPA: beta-propeller domain-containing protein [Burkholderiales bacterium]|nr:beta-propeller domain-containing protein [Burkholderiales bacterium]